MIVVAVVIIVVVGIRDNGRSINGYIDVVELHSSRSMVGGLGGGDYLYPQVVYWWRSPQIPTCLLGSIYAIMGKID